MLVMLVPSPLMDKLACYVLNEWYYAQAEATNCLGVHSISMKVPFSQDSKTYAILMELPGP
jgi:hypothetical protein